MIERPILFSAPMVRAILEGHKTQTRRIVKDVEGLEFLGWCTDTTGDQRNIGAAGFVKPPMDANPTTFARNRYGQPGDLLWVRETTEAFEHGHALLSRYSADGADVVLHGCADPAFDGSVDHWSYPRRSRPSIHMQRKHSRILLEITKIRVERLQEISEDDAKAEGMDIVRREWSGGDSCADQMSGRELFEILWESINGAGSWPANPWVWVVEFKRVKP